MSAAVEPASAADLDPAVPWTGPVRRYDLVKEFVVALVVVSLLTAVLAAVFSSPDDRPATLASWSRSEPKDFVITAVAELDGSSDTAGYGPPYNTASDGPKIGPVALAKLPGTRIPINTAEDLVLKPLETVGALSPTLQEAITTWRTASPADAKRWSDAYTAALDKATFAGGTISHLGSSDLGPLPAITAALLVEARGGALDAALASSQGFYNSDYTKALLFLGDGSYLSDLATAQHLGGDQWGMMNETGNYPGQAWLWLYTFWYQISPFKTSGNADALIWAIMALLTLGLILVPYLPGVRSLPKWLRVYRLIWRDYYRQRR